MTEHVDGLRSLRERMTHIAAVLLSAVASYLSVCILVIWFEMIWAGITQKSSGSDLGGILLNSLILAAAGQLLILFVDRARLNLQGEFHMWRQS